jgi:hypothetical protein
MELKSQFYGRAAGACLGLPFNNDAVKNRMFMTVG